MYISFEKNIDDNIKWLSKQAIGWVTQFFLKILNDTLLLDLGLMVFNVWLSVTLSLCFDVVVDVRYMSLSLMTVTHVPLCPIF